MCYDISFTTSIRSLSDYFPELIIDPQIDLNFSSDHVQAQEYRPYPVVISGDEKYHLVPMEWGVVADYFKTEADIAKGRPLMCNARGEKIVQDKRSYWHRIRTNRCLIPVTAIYEHRAVSIYRNKIPYCISLKGRPVFFLPGLYNYYVDKSTGELIGSFSEVTREANDVIGKIHNGGPNAKRMSLFLPPTLEKRWLDSDLDDKGIQEIIDFMMPSEDIEYCTVAPIRGNKPRSDGKPKHSPYVWPELPELGNDGPSQMTLL